MKNIFNFKNRNFQNTNRTLFLLLAIFSLTMTGVVAQDTDKDTETEKEEMDTRPVKSTFESAWLIDNQSVMVPIKGTFEFDIQHRFGTWQNGYEDFYGLFAPSNIRLGFSYTVIDRLGVGFGFTKSNLTWDLNAKYAILRQTRSDNIPVSVTYFGNIAIDSRPKDNFVNGSDRYSYFNQIIVARKFTPEFSAQIAPSYSHFNAVEAFINSDNEIESIMNNDHFAVSVAGRYKISDVMAVIANYDQPLTKHKSNNPNPNISFGVEMATSSHTFQIFAGNYYFITPQRNNVFNQNNPELFSNYLIGFNITRLWNF
jgi:Membrane bound beta barrel domain (DUF5777)